MKHVLNNKQIADQLRRAAKLLDERYENRFRINAYLHAAEIVEDLGEDIGKFLEKKGRPAVFTGLQHRRRGLASCDAWNARTMELHDLVLEYGP